MTNDRRVVVTGLGVVSSIGIGWPEFWKNLIDGKSGISRISSFDTSDHDLHYAGEIKNFDFRKYFSKKRLYRLGRASQFALAAAKMALKDSRFLFKNLKNANIGMSIGTTMGEGQVIEQIVKHSIEKRKIEVRKIRAMAYPANSISLNVAHELCLSNKNIIFANACAAGNYALGYAYDLIKTSKADYMLAGGGDALSRIAFTGFSRLFAMASNKCQPFDKRRQGMMLGEGAGMLFVETLETALKRNAPIYAEICGYGLSCDANHMTHPDYKGVVKAINKSIEMANISVDEIDYISAHGTGTKENDQAECKAYAEVLGNKLKKIPISSIKSMLGHSMGAASAFESIACCLAIKTNKIPPTINFYEKDSECDIDCVPNKGRNHPTKIVLNNSQAFGGNNACVVFASLGPK